MFKALRFTILVLFLFSAGCGSNDGDSNSSQNTDPYVALVQSVSQPGLLRYPYVVPPTLYEDNVLMQQDFNAFSMAVMTSRHSATIALARSAIGIDTRVPIYIDEDFRLSNMGNVFGGATGYGQIHLDGKFLDILYDAAAYILMAPYWFNIGFPTDFNTTMSNMVSMQNSVLGDAQSQYPHNYRLGFSADWVQQADRIYTEMVAAMVYHEFAHYYYADVLNRARSGGTPFQFIYYMTPKVEDDADFFAGMMFAKTGYNLENLNNAYKLMAYYGMSRTNPALSFANIGDSTSAFYWYQNSNTYSSLGNRLRIAQAGSNTYRTYTAH